MNDTPWYLEALRQGVNLGEDMEKARRDQQELPCMPVAYNSPITDLETVPYDTAVQREQDAYDSGYGKAIRDVLWIIAEHMKNDLDVKAVIYDCACDEIRAAVLALKGEQG